MAKKSLLQSKNKSRHRSIVHVFLSYNAERDSYWMSEQFMVNVKNAVKIVKFKVSK